nr:hypothetical protein [Tanacetum cinerariifolium]
MVRPHTVMVEEGDNKEVVREDRGEIKVRKENGNALGTGMKELVNNVLVDKTGEDRHNKVCDDQVFLFIHIPTRIYNGTLKNLSRLNDSLRSHDKGSDQIAKNCN